MWDAASHEKEVSEAVWMNQEGDREEGEKTTKSIARHDHSGLMMCRASDPLLHSAPEDATVKNAPREASFPRQTALEPVVSPFPDYPELLNLSIRISSPQNQKAII